MKEYKRIRPSEFEGIAGIEYFNFEEDFIEKNIRCIPMIVRFKLDAVGIKLKLDEWSKFTVNERIELATRPCRNPEEIKEYRGFLYDRINLRCGREPTLLEIDPDPAWQITNQLPSLLTGRLKENRIMITVIQWMQLTDLQRFSLIKLCKAGHESKNFPKAIQEFGLLNATSRLYRHYNQL